MPQNVEHTKTRTHKTISKKIYWIDKFYWINKGINRILKCFCVLSQDLEDRKGMNVGFTCNGYAATIFFGGF